MWIVLSFAIVLQIITAFPTDAPYFVNNTRPLVISHRGAWGELPDHSSAAYTTAYFDGADFDEPDLQVTKDGVLFIMHNPWMKETTNIEDIPQFKDRRTTVSFSSNETSFTWTDDYLVNDFTWDELIQAGLKVRNRYPHRNHQFDDVYPPMRLEDAIELLLKLNKETPRTDKESLTGLYIETKWVGFYKKRGVDIAQILYDVLSKYEVETAEKAFKKLPIIIESFEQSSLLFFRNKTNLPLIQLMFYSSQIKYDLQWITQYANGVGPNYQYLFYYKDEPFSLNQPSKFIQECHSLDLKVHPYVLQDDLLIFTSSSISESEVYYLKGVDGMFTEFPENTLQAMKYFIQKKTFLVSE
jgi:glycerophosphoryl diester phosphodiesterase